VDWFLLDTSIWIHVLRRNTPPAIGSRFAELLRSKRAAINELVRLEILVGYKTEGELNRVSVELDGLRLLALSKHIWSAAAILNLHLRSVGITATIADLLIAATAIEHNAVLVHQDSDFDRIAQHSDLRAESFVGVA
jgi:predicted nucleic acid-binding protein